MRRIISISLLTSLLWGLGLNSFLFIHFKINQEEIAELHCINKDKPELNCDGQCYLKDQLEQVNKEETDDEQQIPTGPRYLEIEWLVYHDTGIQNDLKTEPESQKVLVLPKDLRSELHSHPILEPPRDYIS